MRHAHVTLVVGAGDLGRIGGRKFGRICVGRVHEQLDRGILAARHGPSEMSRYDQNSARRVGNERLFRLPVRRPGDDTKCDRGAKRVNQIVRSGRVIEILHDDWQIVHGKRDRRAHQYQQNERQRHCQRERAPIPHDLDKFLGGLRRDTPHLRFQSSRATLPCWRACSTMLTKTSSRERRASRALITFTPFASSRLVVVSLPASASSSVMM